VIPRQEIADELENLLPKGFRELAVVAGGYAASPTKASDIDLWVLGIPRDQFDLVEKSIRDYLDKAGLNGCSGEVGPHIDCTYETFDDSFRVAAIVDGPGENPVQILITTHPTLEELLAKFDLSVHQIGWSLTNPDAMVIGPEWTPVSEEPKVLTLTRPGQTLKRYLRIIPRYGFEPNPLTVKLLSDEIARLDAERFWEEAA
jgi:hypothetical protein